MTVDASQRYNRESPCPICGGFQSGTGRRHCGGFFSRDGKFARCTDESLANGLVRDASGCFTHRLEEPLARSLEKPKHVHLWPLKYHVCDDHSADGVKCWNYQDQTGRELYRYCRADHGAGKGWFERFDPTIGKYRTGSGVMDGVERVPYRLPEAMDFLAVAKDRKERLTLYFPEGEKDVDAIFAAKAIATTNPGGARSFRPEMVKWFQADGALIDVIKCEDIDADGTGELHTQAVRAALEPHVHSFQVVRAKVGKDVRDHLEAGFTLEQLVSVEPGPARSARGRPRTIAVIASDIEEIVGTLMHFKSEYALTAVTLWVIYTHVWPQFQVMPYLGIVSPLHRCGKTRLLELLQLLSSNAKRTGPSLTEATLFRMISAKRMTLLIDEAEKLLNAKSDTAKLVQAIINMGYEAGGVVDRLVQKGGKEWVSMEFPVACPKAITSIGALPEQIADRCIPIALERRPAGAGVAMLLFDEKQKLTQLRGEVEAWAETMEGAYEGASRLAPKPDARSCDHAVVADPGRGRHAGGRLAEAGGPGRVQTGDGGRPRDLGN